MIKKTHSSKGHHAFTLQEDKILGVIIVDCLISSAYHPVLDRGKPMPKLIPVKALWDTGATHCVITQNVIDKLGLGPHDKAEVHHGGGKSIEDVYKVNIGLPNELMIPHINVTKGQATTGEFDLVIGMNLITLGDFAITNLNGKTTVSFRIPSTVMIDFNDGETIITQPEKGDAKDKQDNKPKNPYSGISQNAHCPCGSGKKFKRCHGKDA